VPEPRLGGGHGQEPRVVVDVEEVRREAGVPNVACCSGFTTVAPTVASVMFSSCSATRTASRDRSEMARIALVGAMSRTSQ
jgi:hypothetical protein